LSLVTPPEAGLERPVVFSEARGTVYRASGLGGCLNALVAARKGYDAIPPPTMLQSVFARGHEAEIQVVQRAVEEGTDITNRQEVVELVVTEQPKVVVRGHLDGRIGDRIAEIKSQDQQHWDMFEKWGWERGWFPQYKWQVSVCMIAANAECYLIRYNRETEQWKWSIVREPFYSESEIISRVIGIEQLAKGQLNQVCEWKKWGCGYCHLFEDPPLDHDDELTELAQEYRLAFLQLKEDQARVEVLKARLESAVWKDKIKLDSGWNVTWANQSNRYYDYRKAIEDGLDLTPYQKETKYRSLRVYQRGVDEAGEV
jgi:hypothetical protein